MSNFFGTDFRKSAFIFTPFSRQFGYFCTKKWSWASSKSKRAPYILTRNFEKVRIIICSMKILVSFSLASIHLPNKSRRCLKFYKIYIFWKKEKYCLNLFWRAGRRHFSKLREEIAPDPRPSCRDFLSIDGKVFICMEVHTCNWKRKNKKKCGSTLRCLL